MRSTQDSLRYWLASCAVIPTLTIHEVTSAAPLAAALVAGGLRVIEVSIGTAVALEAVSSIVELVPDAIVGVGAVIDASHFRAAREAGAHFAVSPGASRSLFLAAGAAGIPWMPGVQTVSEIMELRGLGYRVLKFYPAGALGGVRFLRSVAIPVPDVRFCAAGGIHAQNAAQYLSLGNVCCVGGSWLTPEELILERRWTEISELAHDAASLMRCSESRVASH